MLKIVEPLSTAQAMLRKKQRNAEALAEVGKFKSTPTHRNVKYNRKLLFNIKDYFRQKRKIMILLLKTS